MGIPLLLLGVFCLGIAVAYQPWVTDELIRETSGSVRELLEEIKEWEEYDRNMLIGDAVIILGFGIVIIVQSSGALYYAMKLDGILKEAEEPDKRAGQRHIGT
jgi:hypothetical protein